VDNLSVNDLLSPGRMLLLGTVELRRKYRALALKAAAVIGVFLLASLVAGFTRQTQEYFGSYAGIFVVLGIILTSLSFRDYYRRDRNAFHLTLPASWLEKWLIAWLSTSLGWIIISFAGFTLYTFMAAGLNELIFGFHTSPVWWRKELGLLYLHYMVAHALFFMGASIFRKNPLFKTALSLTVLITVLGLLFVLMVWLLAPREWLAEDGRSFHLMMDDNFWKQAVITLDLPRWQTVLERLGKVFYWGLVPVFSWAVSLVRIREIEVKDGV